MLKPIARATVIAATLDLLAAIAMTLLHGRAVGDMLRYVASGPFPAATGWGDGGAVLGVVVHVVLMAMMATAYFVAARRLPQLIAAKALRGRAA